MKSFVKFPSKQSRRRQARRFSPWQSALERLENRTLLAATITPPTSAQMTLEGTTLVVSGLLLDSTIEPVTLTLSVTDGTLSVTHPLIGGVNSFQFTGSGTNTIIIVGSVMDVNETLASGLRYLPRENFFGIDTLSVHLNNLSETDVETVPVIVEAVNDRPSFTIGSDQEVVQGSGLQTVAFIATDISLGPNESSQMVRDFIVTNDHSTLFSVQPDILNDGTLIFTPAVDAVGTAIVTVRLQDNGGTDHGGDDTSDPQTFTITITAVNNAPSFIKGPDQIVPRNSVAQTVTSWATGISAGPADESSQTLDFIVTSNNPALFNIPPAIAANGTLTYTPAVNVTGIATVSVQIHDNGGTTDGGVDTSEVQTFTITVGNGPLPEAPNGNAIYTARGTAKVRAFVVNGMLTVQINGIPSQTYLPSSIVTLTINGGSKNDEINLSGLTDALYDNLASVKINGGAGNDRIVGSVWNDSIDGGAGNDTLTGGEGDDTLIGNAGKDLLVETATTDDLVLDDTSLSGLGTDKLVTIENASLTAADFGSSIDASGFTRGAVTLIGGAGDDTLIGGSKNDAISGRDGNDELSGGAGNDTILGGFGEDTLNGDAGNDLLIGGFDVDSIVGGAGRDTVAGGQGGAARGGDGTNDGDDITAEVISEAFKKLFAFE